MGGFRRVEQAAQTASRTVSAAAIMAGVALVISAVALALVLTIGAKHGG
jgi:hypothetical protein